MAAHEYQARIHWERGGAAFTDKRYSRAHTLAFRRRRGGAGLLLAAGGAGPAVRRGGGRSRGGAGGVAVQLPHAVVPVVRRRPRLRVDEYSDDARGCHGPERRRQDRHGARHAAPAGGFSGERLPTRDEIAAAAPRAHEECFIANSVTTEVRVEPRPDG